MEKKGENKPHAACHGTGPRREVVHLMLRRLNGWDYRQRAIYQITLTFHFHGIIFIERPQAKALGNIIGSFKSKSSSRVGGFLAARSQAQNQAARSPAQGAGFCAGPRAASLWSPGYQDTILFREGQLANMKRYLADNPRRLAIKRLFPDLFKVEGELIVPLSLPAGAMGRGHFAALGNRFLLERPLAQVQVSRRDFAYAREPKPGGGLKIVHDALGNPICASSTPLYAEKKAAFFAAAKHGAVLISPCIRDGERKLYIDTYLEEAGWKVCEINDQIVPGGASVEIRRLSHPVHGPHLRRTAAIGGVPHARGIERIAQSNSPSRFLLSHALLPISTSPHAPKRLSEAK